MAELVVTVDRRASHVLTAGASVKCKIGFLNNARAISVYGALPRLSQRHLCEYAGSEGQSIHALATETERLFNDVRGRFLHRCLLSIFCSRFLHHLFFAALLS